MHSFIPHQKSRHFTGILTREQILKCEWEDKAAVRQYFIPPDAVAKDFVRQSPSERRKQKFDNLAKTWFEEVGHLSLIRQQISNISFLKIIGMGKTALPFIFQELEKVPMLAWLVALEAIVGNDVASSARSQKDAVKTWLEWGEKEGLFERE